MGTNQYQEEEEFEYPEQTDITASWKYANRLPAVNHKTRILHAAELFHGAAMSLSPIHI